LAYSEKEFPSPPAQRCRECDRCIVIVANDGIVELENMIPGMTNSETELRFLIGIEVRIERSDLFENGAPIQCRTTTTVGTP
jgi:hypothetical protein